MRERALHAIFLKDEYMLRELIKIENDLSKTLTESKPFMEIPDYQTRLRDLLCTLTVRIITEE